MPEQPSEGGVFPPGQQEAEEGEEEPGSPVGRGPVTVAAEGAGQEGGAGHQGQETDVAGDLGKVVVVEVHGLMQGPAAPEQVGHQQQDGPLRVQGPDGEERVRLVGPLRQADEVVAGQELGRADGHAPCAGQDDCPEEPGPPPPAHCGLAVAAESQPEGQCHSHDLGLGDAARLAGQHDQADQHGQADDPRPGRAGNARLDQVGAGCLETVLRGPGAGGGAHAEDRPADLEDGQDDDRHQGHPLDDAEVHHLADHDPAVGVDGRPEEPGERPHPVLAEQPVCAEAGHPVDGRHVEHPSTDGWDHHEQEGERKEGPGVHAAEEGAPAPDERVPQGEVALPEELPGKRTQGEVLDQVVARERRGAEQGGHDERNEGHEQQHRRHAPVVGPQQAAQATQPTLCVPSHSSD